MSISDWLDDLRGRPRARERILQALSSSAWLNTTAVAKAAKVSGKLYILIYRLEREGLIESRWEDAPYPRRRLYRLKSPCNDNDRMPA